MKRIRAHLTGNLQVSISAYRKNAGTWKSTTRRAGGKSQYIGIGGNDMTIDEAMAKYKEITNTDENCPAHCNISCDKCVQESKQIAEWLEELKVYQQHEIICNKGYNAGYNKAIDDFVNIAKEHDFKYGKKDITNCVIDFIEFFAEQLKAGGENV